MLTNLVTTLSSFIWIGNVDKIKCILRVWFMILSVSTIINLFNRINNDIYI